MLARLLQISSTTLPVGAFAYSQGLEWAVHSGVVVDEHSAGAWLIDLLNYNLKSFELPLLRQMYLGWVNDDIDAVETVNQRYLASRESAELLAETLQMAYSLQRLLSALTELSESSESSNSNNPSDSHKSKNSTKTKHRKKSSQTSQSSDSNNPTELNNAQKSHDPSPPASDVSAAAFATTVQQKFRHGGEPSYPCVWSFLAASLHINETDALTAYCWSFVENQVLAAMKSIPLGQMAGQRILFKIGGMIPHCVEDARQITESTLSNFSPAWAIACAQHETQYSRLFRS